MSIGKKIALSAAGLISVAALFLTIEHFRGKWQLQRWKARMEAKGEVFDIDKLAPPLPPAEKNGMPALLWASAQLPGSFSDLQPPALRYVSPGRVVPVVKINDWWNRSGSQATNVTWAAFADQLRKYEGAVGRVIEALNAEELQRNIPYRQLFSAPVPDLGTLKRAAMALSSWALCDAREDRLDQATLKLEALLRIPESLRRERLMLSQLVRMAVAQIEFAATWQALQAEGWSDEQLAAIQDGWKKHDFLTPCADALTMERAMAEFEFDLFRESDAHLGDLAKSFGAGGSSSIGKFSAEWLVDMIEEVPEFFRNHIYFPAWRFAWSYQDELYYCRRTQRALDAFRPAIQQRSAAVLLKAFPEDDDEDESLSAYDRVRLMVSPLIASGITRFLRRAWLAETVKELAVAGIALKRYELRHGKLPERLAALVPQFASEIPRDPMDGTALKYCVFDDRFILYSVGWDGKDDGGDVTSDTNKNLHYQFTKDIVWPQPASNDEIQAHWKKR